MLTISEYSTPESFEELRNDFTAVLDKAENASIFATWEWVEAFWKHSAPGRRPFVLAAHDNTGRPAGLLSLARVSRFGVLRVLEVAGCSPSGYPVGDYGGLIAVKGMESAVWRAMLEHLIHSRWSIIDLRNCPAGKGDRERWLARMYRASSSELGWTTRVQPSDICRLIPLPATFEEYLGTLSSNARQNLRRKLRKFNEGGHVLEQVASQDEAARNEAFENLMAMHQQRWAADPSGGAFPDEEARTLHRYIAASLAARGMVDLRVARSAEGEIMGVIYNFRWNGVGYFYTIGTSSDPKWASLSVGTCLLADSIRAAIESGCHTFDMLRGDHEYKAHFGGYATGNLRLTIYRYGWLPKIHGLAASLRHRLKPRIPVQLQAGSPSE